MDISYDYHTEFFWENGTRKLNTYIKIAFENPTRGSSITNAFCIGYERLS